MRLGMASVDKFNVTIKALNQSAVR